MTETIMPCFDDFQVEGQIIGRLLAGYGEVELNLCGCLWAVTNEGKAADFDVALKQMFRIMGAEKRIKAADNIMRSKYIEADFGDTYCTAIADMNWCREIRNQYAHCNWYSIYGQGINIVDLEDIAKSTLPIGELSDHKRPINADLLLQQEMFFMYVNRCLWYLASEYRRWRKKKDDSAALLPISAFSLPPKVERPPKHN